MPPETTVVTFASAFGDAIDSIVDAVIEVWSSLVTDPTILPYFIIGIAAAAVLLGVHIIKRIVWGA